LDAPPEGVLNEARIRDYFTMALPESSGVGRALQAPLDVFLVRKLGVPGHEELAMGAIAAGGARLRLSGSATRR